MTTVPTVENPRDIAAWVNRLIYEGRQPHEAASAAFERAIYEGRSEEILRALGFRWAFYEPWRETTRSERFRRHEPTDDIPEIVESETEPIRSQPRQPTAAPPARRVHLGLVRDKNSLYSKLISVATGVWVPLGDLKRGQCKAIAKGYRHRAAGNLWLADVFDQLTHGLEDEATSIRQRFSEAELEVIWPEKRSEFVSKQTGDVAV